jgi:energy-coupling factor transporter ATP-binding protein EcfA2
MKNRLELFREQIAAFDGAADPLGAIDKGYFIEEPHQSSTNALLKRISLKPQSKILLIGGIGSGKTTQLLKLQQIFQQTPDVGIYPLYIDITEYTKPNTLEVGTLDAIVALELMTILEQNGIQIDEDRKKSIQKFAYGYTVTESHSNPVENFRTQQEKMFAASLKLFSPPSQPSTVRRVPGILNSHPRSSESSSRLAQVISSLVEDFKNQFHQMPYFFFDGLDRVDEAKKFIGMTSSDLQASEIGFTIVGAVSLLYGSFINSIDSIFNYIEYRSAFDVDRDEEAHTFFERVFLARSSRDFFDKDGLKYLISLSGGVLRDLINLAQESIQEAYLADAEIVDREHVGKAVRSMGRAKMLGLDREQYSTLVNFNNNILTVPTSPEEIYLLSGGRILEYRFPERRFDLHPVLKQLLV